MIIYLDVVITLNFIINFVFLKLINIIQNSKENMFRIILSSFFSIILLSSFLLNYQIFNIIKIFGGIILVLIGIKFNSKNKFFTSLCLYYLLQFAYIGVLKIFNVRGCLCLLALLIVCFILLLIMKNRNIKRNYNVQIKLNNKELFIEGYLDTGNIAKYYNKPIIFLDNKYYDKTLTVFTVVNIKTINGDEYINCYKPEEFYIYDNNKKISKDILIAFTNFDNNIKCLLNNFLFN